MSHSHSHTSSSVCQTLEELDFERGIWYAAQYNDLDRVKKLISQGVFVDLRDNAGYTALHYAVRAGHFDVCKFLLERGADINAITKSGHATPLHRAVTIGNHEMVKFLINNKANVQLKDVDGKTVLHRAAETQNYSITEEILNVCPDLKKEVDITGNTPLNYIKNDELKILFA